jgi:hypothetical protein
MTRKAAGSAASRELNGKGCGKQPTADLHREAANMLALQSRQTSSMTSLSISSKAAQAVLRQF